jgi:hypothetical protein
MQVPARTNTSIIEMAAMIASWAAVGVALYTVWKAERDARRRTAFERIVALETCVRSLSEHPTGKGREELLESARTSGAIEEAGRAYQAMLNTFELLAYAVETGIADRKACDGYLSRLGSRARRVLNFIQQYRVACGDQTTYGILERYLRRLALPPAD